jgi:hypothetical protein
VSTVIIPQANLGSAYTYIPRRFAPIESAAPKPGRFYFEPHRIVDEDALMEWLLKPTPTDEASARSARIHARAPRSCAADREPTRKIII